MQGIRKHSLRYLPATYQVYECAQFPAQQHTENLDANDLDDPVWLFCSSKERVSASGHTCRTKRRGEWKTSRACKMFARLSVKWSAISPPVKSYETSNGSYLFSTQLIV